jgi:hypothetical protein
MSTLASQAFSLMRRGRIRLKHISEILSNLIRFIHLPTDNVEMMEYRARSEALALKWKEDDDLT